MGTTTSALENVVLARNRCFFSNVSDCRCTRYSIAIIIINLNLNLKFNEPFSQWLLLHGTYRNAIYTSIDIKINKKQIQTRQIRINIIIRNTKQYNNKKYQIFFLMKVCIYANYTGRYRTHNNITNFFFFFFFFIKSLCMKLYRY